MKKNYYLVTGVTGEVRMHWLYDRNVNVPLYKDHNGGIYTVLCINSLRLFAIKRYLRKINKKFKSNLRVIKWSAT